MAFLRRYVVTIVTVLVLGSSVGLANLESASTPNFSIACPILNIQLPPGAVIQSCGSNGDGVLQVSP